MEHRGVLAVKQQLDNRRKSSEAKTIFDNHENHFDNDLANPPFKIANFFMFVQFAFDFLL